MFDFITIIVNIFFDLIQFEKLLEHYCVYLLKCEKHLLL
jgi:hypothetical protein